MKKLRDRWSHRVHAGHDGLRRGLTERRRMRGVPPGATEHLLPQRIILARHGGRTALSESAAHRALDPEAIHTHELPSLALPSSAFSAPA